MTSSMNPREAALYGLANYLDILVLFSKTFELDRKNFGYHFKIISLAPFAPITAISADGHAKFMSAPICLIHHIICATIGFPCDQCDSWYGYH